MINDDLIFEFLLHIADEKIYSISIPNCILSDGGASILFECLTNQHSLAALKIYNNVTVITGYQKELPILITSTVKLA